MFFPLHCSAHTVVCEALLAWGCVTAWSQPPGKGRELRACQDTTPLGTLPELETTAVHCLSVRSCEVSLSHSRVWIIFQNIPVTYVPFQWQNQTNLHLHLNHQNLIPKCNTEYTLLCVYNKDTKVPPSVYFFKSMKAFIRGGVGFALIHISLP